MVHRIRDPCEIQKDLSTNVDKAIRFCSRVWKEIAYERLIALIDEKTKNGNLVSI